MTSEVKGFIGPGFIIIPNRSLSVEIDQFPDNITFCGHLPFCTQSSNTECQDIKFNSCPHCSSTKAALFLFFVVFLGIIAIIGNSAIVWISYYRFQIKKGGKRDICKISLAVSDILTGTQLIVIIPYNFNRVINSTAAEVSAGVLYSSDSAFAFFGIMFYGFTYISSVLHLLYLGMWRLYAIFHPLKYSFCKEKTVCIGLAIIWLIAVFPSTIVAWFPSSYSATLAVPVLYHMPLLVLGNANDSRLTGWVFIVYLLFPFVLLVVFGTLSTIIGCIKLKKPIKGMRESDYSTSSRNSTLKNDQSKRMFVSIMLMQLGYIFTFVPTLIFLIMLYTDYFTCSNYTEGFVITFYLRMTSSLVNVIVYNLREKSFRNDFIKLVKKLFQTNF